MIFYINIELFLYSLNISYDHLLRITEMLDSCPFFVEFWLPPGQKFSHDILADKLSNTLTSCSRIVKLVVKILSKIKAEVNIMRDAHHLYHFDFVRVIKRCDDT